ncbi:MAG: hypothetical protein JSS81_01510 [Acidobacteria bacterium]|nr:hypothetical protein [Acidobacteriota bacterium]
MKPKLCLFVFWLVFVSAAFGQSVVVTGKKTTYTRPKPSMDFKKTFTVNYPKIRAATPALSRKIEAALDYGKNNLVSLKDEMGEYQWLEEADYEVSYNKNGFLCVYLSATGTAAYPTSIGKYVVVDLKTGNALKAAAVFANFPGLIAEVKKIQDTEVKQSIEDLKKEPDFQGENPESLFEYTKFEALNLEGFSITDDGVSFHYEYGFPHVIYALEPGGDYFLGWKDIKPFVKPTGPFARFVK